MLRRRGELLGETGALCWERGERLLRAGGGGRGGDAAAFCGEDAEDAAA